MQTHATDPNCKTQRTVSNKQPTHNQDSPINQWWVRRVCDDTIVAGPYTSEFAALIAARRLGTGYGPHNGPELLPGDIVGDEQRQLVTDGGILTTTLERVGISQPNTEPSRPTLPSELSIDQAFYLLKNRRRRELLYNLRPAYDLDISLGLRTVARNMAARENDKRYSDVTSREYKRVYVSLYQTHAPLLKKHRLIDKDSDGHYSLTSTGVQLHEVLKAFESEFVQGDSEDAERLDSRPEDLVTDGGKTVRESSNLSETPTMAVLEALDAADERVVSIGGVDTALMDSPYTSDQIFKALRMLERDGTIYKPSKRTVARTDRDGRGDD